VSRLDPQLEDVTPSHPVAKLAYEKVKSCKFNYVHVIAGWYLKDDERKYYLAEVRGNDLEVGFNRLDWLSEYEIQNEK